MLFFTTNIHLCAVGKERRDEGNLTKKIQTRNVQFLAHTTGVAVTSKKLSNNSCQKKSLNDAI